MISASQDVFNIVKATEMHINVYINNNNLSNLKNSILFKVKLYFELDNATFKNLSCDNEAMSENHKLQLIITICNSYIKLMMHSLSKHSEIISKRHFFSKIVLFSHQ